MNSGHFWKDREKLTGELSLSLRTRRIPVLTYGLSAIYRFQFKTVSSFTSWSGLRGGAVVVKGLVHIFTQVLKEKPQAVVTF